MNKRKPIGHSLPVKMGTSNAYVCNDKRLHHQQSPNETGRARRLLETVWLYVQICETMAPLTKAPRLPSNSMSVIRS